MSGSDESFRRLVASEEGQYFERKSLFEGPPGAKTHRDRKAVRSDVAEQVAAFANADGGTLVLGVEDDGAITGCPYQDEGALSALLDVPSSRLTPPLALSGEVREVDGKKLIVFEVSPAARAVMVQGNGFPRREGDEVIRMSQEAINRIKDGGLVESPEARPASGVGVADLSAELIERARAAAAFLGSAEEYLVARRLADSRGSALALRQGAVWLFARDPSVIQHPNLGVRVFRVHGTEQRVGTERNVQDFPWIEGNLVSVLEVARDRIESLVRRSTRLHDLFFKESPEYPPLAWQEALVNALAHRDYSIEGRGVEVHMYDDRIEISSPGGLLSGVSLDALLARERLHRSRNPRVCRVLTELGVMRQQGEGIPRIIEEMELSWLPSPELSEEHGSFVVKLRNEPIFQSTDEAWTRHVQELPLGVRLRRALVAFHDSPFQSGDYQSLNRVDRDLAYRELKELESGGYIQPEGATRGRKYRVVKPAQLESARSVSPTRRLLERMLANGYVTNTDYRDAFSVDRFEATRALSEAVERDELIREGERRGTRYLPGPKWPPKERG